MRQSQLPLAFLLALFTASIVTTGIGLGWFGTKNPWQQIGNDIDGEASSDYSGESVSLSRDGKIVAVGAQRNRGNGDICFGHVQIGRAHV